MAPSEIAAEVVHMLAVELSVPETSLTPEQLLVDDLGLDSLAAVRLLSTVETHFGVELISTDYLEVRCVGDLIRFVERELAAEGAHS
jgi:acyl carrier protein